MSALNYPPGMGFLNCALYSNLCKTTKVSENAPQTLALPQQIPSKVLLHLFTLYCGLPYISPDRVLHHINTGNLIRSLYLSEGGISCNAAT
jgi:hypothetical protein